MLGEGEGTQKGIRRMSINQAYLIKGWLLGEHPPKEVMEAIDAVIAGLSANTPCVEIHLPESSAIPSVEVIERDEPTDEQPKPEKKRREWSPEARAAAAERLRARQAAGLMKRKEPAEPGEAQALSPR